jgi:hypothetical protein
VLEAHSGADRGGEVRAADVVQQRVLDVGAARQRSKETRGQDLAVTDPQGTEAPA